MPGERSRLLYQKALNLFSGGVNSPVRASVRPYPFYVKSAEGAYLYTVDEERLIDYVLGYGPLILGHKHPEVYEAVSKQLERGWLYGAPTEAEVLLAERITRHVMPGGKVRFVSTGTEATMTAIRLARGYTQRNYIVKFEGCYHGSHDSVLVSAGSAASEYGVPNSLGVPDDVARLTLVVPYNDLQELDKVMSKFGDQVAAIIVEPVIGNMGVIPPKRDFLSSLRRYCDEYGCMLIFDEVITGFRLSLGGAQEYYNVRADVVTLGKIIGGGFPIGAVVSKQEVIDSLAPTGKVFNAGTFNSHPISMVAGLATLEVLEKTDALKKASWAARELVRGLSDIAEDLRINCWINRVESMFQIFFTDVEVDNAEKARKSDRKLYSLLHEELIKRGVFIAPSQFEALFTSSSHGENEINLTLEALEDVLKRIRDHGA